MSNNFKHPLSKYVQNHHQFLLNPFEGFDSVFRSVFGQFVGRLFCQIFDQIVGQGFDQGLGEEKKEAINTVYSTTRPWGKTFKNNGTNKKYAKPLKL